MTNDVDFLVIGAGACGLCAAIAATDAGLSAAIVEKTDRAGGNSALSTGSVPAAGSRFQKEAGIDDDAETYFQDLMSIAGETDDPELVRRMTAVSADTVEWLVDAVKARIELVTAYKHIGHSVPRLHAPKSRRGQDLVDDLVRAVEEREIPLAMGNTVKRLLVEGDRVAGAVIDTGDGNEIEFRAAATLLALNGFGANRKLVERFTPEIAGAQYFGAAGSDGEAVEWGETLGARLVNMEAYQGYAAVADPHGSILSWTTIEKGGVLLGGNGARFGDESLGYSGFAKHVLAQGDYAYAIFDQRIFEIAMQEEEFAELHAHGGLKTGDTVADVARAQGLDGEAAEAAVAEYNTAAQAGEADRFGRTEFGLAPLEPPFYSCRTVPALFHTQGGLKVDADGRVLRLDGTPIPGLFAGGGAAAGISGRSGATGYASGNGLLTAVALGRLAALSAARDLAKADA
ncbi:fumarate reductase/succinate dehydrogenase flavoprotein domain-containing protein [Roseivivax marinus]|uniref:Fumarate reductase/succinate dehydrogenase flavoprotein domain-containing protein n=1 Tax=Roseivivax marinus TaxID=1379903 RepID=W4HDX7_9RHOB|nr:FAD-binding protein [Roseivivax marinus]ETW10967.1 fumarate reductase/succinate dehydrogenase flavoprotein domain-containing protein [Roseivivax marinus]